MDETMKFFRWWQGDAERRLCTLEQAIGSYCASFPGRLLPLLSELLSPKARFLAKTEIQPDGCWLWIGAQLRRGYGSFRYCGKTVSAHRYSYQAFKGDIQEGLVIMHTCDNTSCVNPEHLRCGTQQENIADRDKKGRTAKGSRNGGSKLTDEQVAQIRASSDTQVVLARRYKVHQTTISKIKLNQKWRED